MIKNPLLHEYEMVLMGQESANLLKFFQGAEKEREKNALLIWRYAIENFLHWKPKEAKHYINSELVHEMHLDKVIRYIPFPCELNPQKDYIYILSLLYPEKIKINRKHMILHYFNSVIEKKEDGRFARGYFTEEDGKEKACICLLHVLTSFANYSCIDDIYKDFFMDGGFLLIKEYKLKYPCYSLFESQIDFLHEALPESQRNEFLYNYYKFKQGRKVVSGELKKLDKVYTAKRNCN